MKGRKQRAAPQRGTFIFDIIGKWAGEMFADERQEDAQLFNSAEAVHQRDWQERMANTAVRRHADDLKAAGFNPLLAIHPGGGAATPSGAAASSGMAGGGGATNFAASMASAAQIEVAETQADKNRAEAEEIRERTKNYDPQRREIEARIPTHPQAVEESRQRIGESAARIEKIWEEAKLASSSAANVQQQTINLRETVPQIRANIEQLKALTAKESAATDEIKQRVKQNLPELERILGNLERVQREMAQPGHANQERAADSLVGQIGAYLRQLTGIGIIAVPGRAGGRTTNIGTINNRR